jgi:hypothetical protein
LYTHIYGAVPRGVSDGTEVEVAELAVLLVVLVAPSVVVDITADETTSATEAKEAAILEAISSALTVGDDIDEVDVEVTVIESEPEEDVA